MFKKIKEFFKKPIKQEEDLLTSIKFFEEDKVITKENYLKELELKYSYNLPNDFDINKPCILILDDNEGIISFLLDDLDYFKENNLFDFSKFNILPISGQYAAFSLKFLYLKNKNLNIKFAIIDLTLGGSIMTDEGIIKYNGVDVYKMIEEYNKEDFSFFFYTGNNLNPYILSNEKLINKFNKVKGKDIKDFVLFKTSLTPDKRKTYILNFLKKGIKGGS